MTRELAPHMNNNNALLGSSGFVGSTLLAQTTFAGHFRSTNIQELSNNKWDLVVCAAAPGAKWIANQDPDADRTNIDTLIQHIDQTDCQRFVLISTVDVFADPIGVDEQSLVKEDGLHAYGLNRRALEKFVEGRFENHLIIRLPGLVGPGLRKNVIFDFQNNNNLEMIDSRSVFQFYPMNRLWRDIQVALDQNLALVHLTAEPVSVADIATRGFKLKFEQVLELEPVRYDFRSIHSELFGGRGGYQYNREDSLQAIQVYAHSDASGLTN